MFSPSLIKFARSISGPIQGIHCLLEHVLGSEINPVRISLKTKGESAEFGQRDFRDERVKL